MFTKQHNGYFIAALVYVDDAFLTGDDSHGIFALKQALHNAFTIKDLGLARYFLGLEICRYDQGIMISQRKYILDILDDLGLSACKPPSIPLPTNLKLSVDQAAILSNPESYRRLIGRLLYLNLSRPDVSYAIQHLSQFVTYPRAPHMEAAIHVVKYLNNTINKGLFYPTSSDLSLTAYSDADWGRCISARRSLTGYCIFLGHSLVSWKTKKKKNRKQFLNPPLNLNTEVCQKQLVK